MAETTSLSELDVLKSTDVVDIGVSLLSDKLQKENIQKLLTIFLEKTKEVETAFLDIASQQSLDLAIGWWLDRIGELAHVTRIPQEEDDVYRERIRFGIAVNNADGTPDTMINIIKSYTHSTYVALTRSGVSFGTITLDGYLNIDNTLLTLLYQIAPICTNWDVHSNPAGSALLLAYESVTSEADIFQVTTDNGATYTNLNTTEEGGSSFSPWFITTVDDEADNTFHTREEGNFIPLFTENINGDTSVPLHWSVSTTSIDTLTFNYDEMVYNNPLYGDFVTDFENNILYINRYTISGQYPFMISCNPKYKIVTSVYEHLINNLL